MRHLALIAGLVTLSGCALILGIEDVPTPDGGVDSGVDAVSPDGGNDGGDSGPDGSSKGFCASNPGALFCDDFDGDAGLSQWARDSGTFSIVPTPAGGGSPPSSLLASATFTAYMTKTISVPSSSKPTFSFAARISDCSANVDVLWMYVEGSTKFGPYVFRTESGSFVMKNISTSAGKIWAPCDTAWHTFAFEVQDTAVNGRFDGTSLNVETIPSHTHNGLTVYVGVVAGGPRNVHVDNVLVSSP